MDGSALRLPATLAMLLALSMVAGAQTSQQAGTLTIAGQPDQAALVRINGKSYVDIESLARITHGSIRFQGSQTVLTLPLSAGTAVAAPVPPSRPTDFSAAYLSAEIEALSQIREWHAALFNAIQNNYPVAGNWVDPLRRSADAKLQLAVAAATTGPDQKAAELLKNEFTNMQQMSDQFVAMHVKAANIAPDSLDKDPLNQKILDCAHALASMAATKQFQDEVSCR
jgi:hypothetical protein